MYIMYKYPMEGRKKDAARVFSVVLSDRTSGSGHKLDFYLSLRKIFLTINVIERWNK